MLSNVFDDTVQSGPNQAMQRTAPPLRCVTVV